jgi:bifunctional UDP-N-acetylglucosamine pyrophosphorylase / glucosamine-1-phosphate N-acetyltransferase
MPSANDQRFAIAILAAGKGTRLKSKLPKVIHQIGGRPLLGHVIVAASKVVAPADIFCIIGHEAERVRLTVQSYGTGFIEQREQRGTGHALMQSREALAGYEHVLVLSGDVPLIRTETIAAVRDFHISKHSDMTILTAEPPDPFGYGRIVRRVRDGKATDEVEGIVEQKQLKGEQLALREINSGIYAFNVKELFVRLDRLTTDNPHGEFYLTDIAAILQGDGRKVLAVRAEDSNEVLGINTRRELAVLDDMLRTRKTTELMDNGVTIYRPETVTIDADVTVGADTVIEPFVQLLGKTQIGDECLVRSYSVITNSKIGSRVTVRHGCIMEDAEVDNAAIIGPYSHLRPASKIGEGAHVGNFVETKKTKLGKGSKANHLTYLGDAEIGEGVNIGAGTITCNYDGVNKFGTVIEDGVFVGSDSTLVAPVKIGKGAYIGAASCITKDIPADGLGLTRPELVIKENWATAKREKMKRAKKEAEAKGNSR